MFVTPISRIFGVNSQLALCRREGVGKAARSV